ncbi:hypothetical protein GHU05_00015 [Fructobacillus tropaeoli]|uniref:hypothetical protein n=1 Tax=Fructobacillus tropaeoli TaxID=709323 RepID=UPI001455DFBE|nr:hypothetical protein [Fructobacillus tropaeoli]NLS37336.1 hypothetical protein [Fructobacillus tropaeoli]
MLHLLVSADSLSERDNSKTPTYSSDIVSSLGNGIPSYSNNEIVKENLRNAGITQLTVDDNSHIFNNDSTQASYRVGLNPKYKYSILQVSPQNGLKNDYPFMMSHAALVSGNTVTPLNATKKC